MHTLSTLLASVSGQAQSALPSSPPPPAAPQAAAPPASTIIPDISLTWGGYFQALAILCFALAALWILLWLVRRVGNAGGPISSANLRVESRLALGPKNWLYVVRCQNKRLVLGVSEKNISLVSETPLSEEELRAPAQKSLLNFKGISALLPGRKKTGVEDDFPLLQDPEPQQKSAFDDFLQGEKGKTDKL